jgi:mannose-6-phosphate isomerase-like protein (cupin superfamily)
METPVEDKINLAAKLATFSEYFSPRTVAQLNNLDVMVVKAKGEFVWHKHDETDDFFLVLKGNSIFRCETEPSPLGPERCTSFPRVSSIAPEPRKKCTYC